MFDIIVTAINVRQNPEAFAITIVDFSISTTNPCTVVGEEEWKTKHENFLENKTVKSE